MTKQKSGRSLSYASQLRKLSAQHDHISYMLDICNDAIRQLSDGIGTGCTFKFAMQDRELLQFNIPPGDGGFCLSFFMSWRTYFHRQLSEVTDAMQTITIGSALNKG